MSWPDRKWGWVGAEVAAELGRRGHKIRARLDADLAGQAFVIAEEPEGAVAAAVINVRDQQRAANRCAKLVLMEGRVDRRRAAWCGLIDRFLVGVVGLHPPAFIAPIGRAVQIFRA